MDIGTGHVMRCLTLADELRERGADVSFVCRKAPGNLIQHIEDKGYRVYPLPLDIDLSVDRDLTQKILQKQTELIDWLIIDHYEIDASWEFYLRKYANKIMVIDDLANRKHDCDLLLDQNFYENFEIRYDELVPYNCRKLLGPKYALLRPEFAETLKNLKQRNCKVNKILISFGGNDPTDETTKSLKAIMSLNRPDIAVDVVVGSSNPHKEKIEHICSAMTNANFYCQIDNMAQLMADADLSIGASGATTWERCCLGLPSIVMTLAENQRELANHLGKKRIVMHLGWHKEVEESDINEAVKKLLHNPEKIKIMSEKSRALVDGEGIKRVMNTIQKTLCVVDSILLG